MRSNRSMSSRPRHHETWMWRQQHGEAIRVAARALTRLADFESRQCDGPDERWQHPPGGGRPGNEPRRFDGPQSWRPFQGTPWPRQWRPYFYGYQRPEGDWPRRPSSARPWDWNPRPLPRRGAPVAAIRAPRRKFHDEWETRRPRGPEPRGPCGEAPKGQLMIRSESLKALCVEAPQGQPMIH